MKINAFLAIRMGSNRVPLKNFRLLNGRCVYEYLTSESLKSKFITDLYVNTDNRLAIEIVKETYGDNLHYYLRPKSLGTSKVTLDEYVYDFMQNNPSDITVFLNPCSVFLSAKSIDNGIEQLIDRELDSCVASRVEQTHCFYENLPINFNFNEKQPPSQELKPVHSMTSGFFIWRNDAFLKAYQKYGFANFCGKFESIGLSALETIDIDEEDDFLLAQQYLKFMEDKPNEKEYHPTIAALIESGKSFIN